MDLDLEYKYFHSEDEKEEGAKIYSERYAHLVKSKFSLFIGPIDVDFEPTLKKYLESRVELIKYTLKYDSYYSKKCTVLAITKEIVITKENMYFVPDITFDLILTEYDIDKIDIYPLDPEISI